MATLPTVLVFSGAVNKKAERKLDCLWGLNAIEILSNPIPSNVLAKLTTCSSYLWCWKCKGRKYKLG